MCLRVDASDLSTPLSRKCQSNSLQLAFGIIQAVLPTSVGRWEGSRHAFSLPPVSSEAEVCAEGHQRHATLLSPESQLPAGSVFWEPVSQGWKENTSELNSALLPCWAVTGPLEVSRRRGSWRSEGLPQSLPAR